MSTGHSSNDTAHSALNTVGETHMTAEEKADQSADLKVTLLVFTALVVIAVVTISGWSPQF